MQDMPDLTLQDLAPPKSNFQLLAALAVANAAPSDHGEGDDDGDDASDFFFFPHDLEPRPLLSAETVQNRMSDKNEDDDGKHVKIDISEKHEFTVEEIDKDRNLDSAGRSLTACGGNHFDLVTGEAGVITTPNYPANYGPDLSCLWKFEASGDESGGESPLSRSDYAKISIQFPPQAPSYAKMSLTCSNVRTEACSSALDLKDYVLVNPDPRENRYYRCDVFVILSSLSIVKYMIIPFLLRQDLRLLPKVLHAALQGQPDGRLLQVQLGEGVWRLHLPVEGDGRQERLRHHRVHHAHNHHHHFNDNLHHSNHNRHHNHNNGSHINKADSIDNDNDDRDNNFNSDDDNNRGSRDPKPQPQWSP